MVVAKVQRQPRLNLGGWKCICVRFTSVPQHLSRESFSYSALYCWGYCLAEVRRDVITPTTSSLTNDFVCRCAGNARFAWAFYMRGYMCDSQQFHPLSSLAARCTFLHPPPPLSSHIGEFSLVCATLLKHPLTSCTSPPYNDCSRENSKVFLFLFLFLSFPRFPSIIYGSRPVLMSFSAIYLSNFLPARSTHILPPPLLFAAHVELRAAPRELISNQMHRNIPMLYVDPPHHTQ